MIVNIASNDYSNYSHDNARALRSVGVDCIDVVLQRHRFYKDQSRQVDLGQMLKIVKQASIVQVMHSDDKLYDYVKDSGKKIIVYHTGTRYRENHLNLERIFKGVTSISDQTEFMTLGSHKYIVSPVDLDLAPTIKFKPIKVGHYPSHAWTKGTDEIIEMLSPFMKRINWQHSTGLVDHPEQLRRMAKCDIYVELFKPEIKGKAYGCFGVTALEACAMGKITVTNNLFPKVYTDVYGTCPMTIINEKEKFINYFNQILDADVKFISDLQVQNYEIMKQNHSFVNTGNRLARIIYG
jgi:hypothetical protein